jgi:uncharacterized membrane protein YoaK (UPF0700 family)
MRPVSYAVLLLAFGLAVVSALLNYLFDNPKLFAISLMLVAAYYIMLLAFRNTRK